MELRSLNIKAPTDLGSTHSIPGDCKWSRVLNYKLKYIAFILIFALLSQIGQIATAQEPPFLLPQTSDLSKIKSAIINTTKGKMIFELFPDEAPWHVANFKFLADNGFYRGRAFHIKIDDFIIQTGRNSTQEMHYFLPAEFSQRKHEFGTLGMARAADYLNPQRNSSSTQFHILLGDARNMDGSYTIFGKLLDGSEILESLRQNDRITEISAYLEDVNYKQHAKFLNDLDPWKVSLNR